MSSENDDAVNAVGTGCVMAMFVAVGMAGCGLVFLSIKESAGLMCLGAVWGWSYGYWQAMRFFAKERAKKAEKPEPKEQENDGK